jgi:FHA domain
MTDERARTPRTLLIADHLWETFSSMAAEMGSDREALINQALYTFARLNGFLLAADLQKIVPRSALTDSGRLRIAPPPEERPTAARGQGDPDRVEVGRQLAAAGMPRRVPVPTAPGHADPSNETTDDSGATSLELPAVAGPARPRTSIMSGRAQEAVQAAAASRTIALLAGDGEEIGRVQKDRFLIGRGKHCDLVINSGKVSREHAAIVREGDAWFIEDLGSSNGTWFEKRRLTRRQIQDGDEYYVCAEKLTCAFKD